MPPVSAVGTLPLATLEARDPVAVSTLAFSLPCKSRRPGSRRLHAGHHWPVIGTPARLHHGRTAKSTAFGATSITLTTPKQRTPSSRNPRNQALSGTSSWSPPDASRAPFPDRCRVAGGISPPAPTDPHVSLSTHTARAVQLSGRSAVPRVHEQLGRPRMDSLQPRS
jgi:hypothetical protein